VKEALVNPSSSVPQRGEVVGFRQKTAEFDEASILDMPSKPYMLRVSTRKPGTHTR
jgi:hypothetical protein